MNRYSMIAVLTVVAFLFPMTAQAAPVGNFTAVKGSVDISGADGLSRPAQVGDPVLEGDIVRTKSKSRVEVLFGDGSILRLAPNSRIEVSQYDMGGAQDMGILKLFRGKVQSIVKRAAGFFGNKGNRFEIHTPTAVAGVRGTDFFTWYSDGQSGAAVKEGTVYTYAANRPNQVKTVRKGQSSIVVSADEDPVIGTATDEELTLGGDEKDGEPAAFVGEPETDSFATEESTEVVDDGETTKIIPQVVDTYVPDFDLLLAGGFLDGTLVGDISAGTLTLSGAYNSATAASAMTVGGDLSNGGAFQGSLGGVLGSWEGLLSSIYVDPDGKAGFIYGTLSGEVTAGQLSASGEVAKTAALGTVADPAADLVLDDFFFPVPVIGTPDADPSVKGLLTANIDTGVDRWLGVYSLTSTETGYTPLSVNANYGFANFGDYEGVDAGGSPADIPYLMVGYANIKDDQAGHVRVDDVGNLFYIDDLYHGTFDMSYRGVYDGGGNLTLAGSGMLILDPLDYSGSWGGVGTIYYNDQGSSAVVAYDAGLMGLVATATGYDFFAAGDYFMAAPVSETDPFIWSTDIGGSDNTGSGDFLQGTTAGIWQYSANSYGLPGDMLGAAAALKVSTDDGQVTVEQLFGDLRGEYFTAPLNYEASDGLFRVRGDLDVVSLTAAEEDLNFLQGDLYSSLSGSLGSAGAIQGGGYGGGYLQAFQDTATGQGLGIFSLGLNDSNTYSGKAAGAQAMDAMVGGEVDYFSAPLVGDLGTFSGYGGGQGYFLADATGTMNADGSITGDLAGTLMTQDFMADMTGSLFGQSDGGEIAGTGTWIGQGVGTIDNFKALSHVASFGSDIAHGTRRFEGSYYFTGEGTAYYEYYPEYYYSFDTVGQTGEVREESRGVSYYSNDYTRTFYNADGTTRIQTHTYYDDWNGNTEETQGTWDPATFDLASLTQTPEASGYWNWQDDYVGSTSSGYLNGLFGGTASLWSGTDIPVTAMGTFGNGGPASVWMTSINSYNTNAEDSNLEYTTYDGGAYEGFVGGTHDHGALDGRFLAVYVDPSGNAGYLSGPLSGTAYADAGMFGMDGVLNRQFVTDQMGIDAAHLDDYWAGDNWGMALSGTLGGSGMVQAGGFDSAGGYGGGWGDFETGAIAGQNWGIFSAEMYGEFTNPESAATWTSKTGGQGTFGGTNPVKTYEGEYDYTGGTYGYYDFQYSEDNSYGYVRAYSSDGAGGLPNYYADYDEDGSYSGYDYDTHTSINGNWNDPEDPRYLADLSELSQAPAAFGPDYTLEYLNDGIESDNDNGFWLADTASTWADGKISADVSGRFITMTQMGTLDGELLGTYSGNAEGLWEAVSLGTWAGTPLSFASSFGYGGFDGYEENGPPATVFHARKEYEGSYNFSGGGSYYYDFYGDNSYSYVSDSGNGENYFIYFNSDGTYSGYDYVAGQSISGNWTDPEDPNYHADLAELAATPAGSGSWNYQYENIDTVDSGFLSGILGGSDDIWTATDIGATVLGSFSGYGGYGGDSVWGTEIRSYDVLDETPTTLTGSGKGGAYVGFLSGTRLDDALDGMVTALYLDPDGNLGFLTGGLDGAIYPNIGMFEMDGTLNRFEIVSGLGGLPEDFDPYVDYSFDHYYSYGGFGGAGAINGYGGQGMTATVNWYDSDLGLGDPDPSGGLPENPKMAGVWASFQYGDYDYDGTFDGDTVWNLYTEGEWNDGGSQYQMVVDGSQWVDGKAEGKVAGAWVDMDNYITGVMGGELKGTFDANQFTWEAATSGVMFDTETFLAMAGTEAGRAALQGMNVPGFEVGRANLQGSVVDALNGDVAVNMWNTTFFAHNSTANAPSIWASGAVTGNNPNARSYVNVPVSGGGVSAQFYMQNYNAGGNWSASVNNGSGTVGSHSVAFQGAAAGQAAGGTDPFNANASIDFSGTASGVVTSATAAP
ncbi:MAG: FecR domain-containing protein [Desulfobacterales bacterium]|nr:FecR domain-containing protein [Desulfobacterales bacterium]